MNRFEVTLERAGYGELTVIPGLSFAVSGGELLVLLGPNGAGKTTALRAVVGTVDVGRRSIRLDGADLSALPAWGLARAGVVVIALSGGGGPPQATSKPSRRRERRGMSLATIPQRQGAMMRPGSPVAPVSVWQLLQSPDVTLPCIARVFCPSVTTAVSGGRGTSRVLKLPTPFTLSRNWRLRESVTMTVRFGGRGVPLQSVGSWSVG